MIWEVETNGALLVRFSSFSDDTSVCFCFFCITCSLARFWYHCAKCNVCVRRFLVLSASTEPEHDVTRVTSLPTGFGFVTHFARRRARFFLRCDAKRNSQFPQQSRDHTCENVLHVMHIQRYRTATNEVLRSASTRGNSLEKGRLVWFVHHNFRNMCLCYNF